MKKDKKKKCKFKKRRHDGCMWYEFERQDVLNMIDFCFCTTFRLQMANEKTEDIFAEHIKTGCQIPIKELDDMDPSECLYYLCFLYDIDLSPEGELNQSLMFEIIVMDA